VQVLPQLMPPELLVTVPDPVPLSVTVSTYNGVAVKPALTDWSVDIVTVHVVVDPEQAPLHPEKE